MNAEPILNKQDILGWLKDNPNFLEQCPEAADLLLPPKLKSKKGIADFQSYLLDRVKADKEMVLETTREIVENARNNMNNQTRIHMAVLHILEAQSFDELITSITMDLTAMLDVDITALLVETDGNTIPHTNIPGLKMVPKGTIDKWMEDRPARLQADITGLEAIFGSGANLVRSQALIRIDISLDMPPALLCFGSRNAMTFEDGQGIEQISFLARVIERCIRLWLTVPN
ncbi:MAG: DUF484 family protein [Pseudomonadota bacterium]|nr:hypothetical protein [Alphaproteobacteria bacterium]MCS5596575.1 DUF484 family protein [Alphaproteobacteria bacterium]MEC7703562.1 DUF484 family protein [Pseudomonadota bacterium]MEC9235856.1 DUF484 family protein [Pseudomonadota bacterium]MED5423684.1 DUF484 family protein [Pseudomonadota bacterium]|tara:strand:+ start:1273 stop:1962 length:690 start_codon:yes stop_codon:yes gene_type:complete